MFEIAGISPADRATYESPFHTTQHKLLHYFMSSLIIIPTYMAMVFHSVRLAYEWLDQQPQVIIYVREQAFRDLFIFLLTFLPAIVFSLALVPLVLSQLIVHRPYWRTGLTHRGLLLAVSLLWTVYISQLDDKQPQEKILYEVLQIGMLFIGILFWLDIRRRFGRLLLIILGLIGLLVTVNVVIPNLVPELLLSVNLWSLVWLIAGINFIGLILYFIYYLSSGNWNFRAEPLLNVNKSKIGAVLLSIVCIYLFRFASPGQLQPISSRIWFALLPLIAMLAAAHPRLFFSRQVAYLRHLYAPIRHDHLRSRASATLQETVFINRLRRWFQRYVNLNNQSIGILLAFILGGFGIPLLQVFLILRAGDAPKPPSSEPPVVVNNYYVPLPTATPITASPSATPTTASLSNTQPLTSPASTPEATPNPNADVTGNTTEGLPDIELINLMALGLPSGIVFALIYVTYWVIRNRQKYIVIPLVVLGNRQEKTQLAGIANQIGHALTDEIRQIGIQMQLRQIENTHAGASSAFAHFVATGQEPEFITQLKSLTSLDDIPAGSALRSLLLFLTNTLAVIKVRGTLRRRADNSLELWVELSRRGDQVVAVDKVIVTSLVSDDLDETTLHKITHEMALKLILKLGQNYHLASSWQSLEAFLEGLAAVNDRNWWRAIEAFRVAIHREESQRGTFGIGHYHLGAALLSLGEISDARKHLEQAELSGPPLAETHYTLALIDAFANWDHLHEKEIEFKHLTHRCNLALRLRPNFAEAYHLLGAVNYQLGKLIERHATRRYQEDHSPSLKTGNRFDWEYRFRRSRSYLRKAVRAYDRNIEQILPESDSSDGTRVELERLLQARMTATHQLGDSLRTLTYFWEADTYYEDVLTCYPDNLRTLIDSAQNYCLARQWQRADEFISREVMRVPEAQWHSDANLFAGWALAGGVHETILYDLMRVRILLGLISATVFLTISQSPLSGPISNPILLILPGIIFLSCTFAFIVIQYAILQKQIHIPFLLDALKLKEQLGRATNHIDFAIHQRPRFITRWLTTDWQHPFDQATKSLGGEILPNENIIFRLGKAIIGRFRQKTNQGDLYYTDFSTSDPNFVKQLRLWLAWRMDSFDYIDQGDSLVETRKAFQKQTFCKNTLTQEGYIEPLFAVYPMPIPDFVDTYTQFKLHKKQFIILLEDIKQSGRLHGMSHAWEKLRLAVFALNNWKRAEISYRTQFAGAESNSSTSEPKPDAPPSAPSFGDRWMFMQFCELSVFTLRLLMEAWAFETGWVMADKAIMHMENWAHRFWPQDQKPERPDSERFRVSPFVFRYNLATLCAAKAYCALQMQDDPETAARMEAYNELCFRDNKPYDEYRNIVNDAVASAQQDVSKALYTLPRHQLALLVQALLYKRQGLVSEAANELYRLLQVISPFDPTEYIANWQLLQKPNCEEMAKRPEMMPLLADDFETYAEFLTRTETQDEQQVNQIMRELWAKKTKQYPGLKEFWGGRRGAIRGSDTPSITDDPNNSKELWECLYEYQLDKRRREMMAADLRERMHKQSLVSGQESMGNFVNRAIVHKALADIFFNTAGKQIFSIGHMKQAVTLMLHRDREADYLLLYADRLDLMDRFKDAQAVVTTLRNIRYFLEPQTFSITKKRQVELLACIMNSRLGNHSASLAADEQLWEEWERNQQYNPLPIDENNKPIHQETTPRTYQYRERLGNPELIEFYDNFLADLVTHKDEIIGKNSPDEQEDEEKRRAKLVKTLEQFEDLKLLVAGRRDWTAGLARHYIVQEKMANLVKILHGVDWVQKGPTIGSPPDAQTLRDQKPRVNIAWNMAVRMADFVGRESLYTLEQISQITNNIAFNRVELGLDYTGKTTKQKPIGIKNQAAVRSAIQITEELLEFAQDNKSENASEYTARYRFYLRNYYDTLGWLEYRTIEPTSNSSTYRLRARSREDLLNDLKIASEALEKAVGYNQSSSIVYYHLSRIHLAAMERLWQGSKQITTESVSEIAAIFQDHLRLATTYWRDAQNADINNRLKPRISWIGQRIEKYATAWENRFLESLQGPGDGDK